MNPMVEKLMMQATDTPEFNRGGYYWPPQYVEKFAELIVKECAGIFSETSGDMNGTYRDQIYEHFGVE